MEGTAERLQAEHQRLLERFEEQRKAAETAAGQLREIRESAASKEESFEKELAMAQRMAQLYRESAEERTKRCSELEGVVKELHSHMEATEAAHREAVEKLNDARKAAEATLAQVCGEREGERRGSVRSSARARLS